MFWKCPKIQNFWKEVKENIANINGNNLVLSPTHCILAADLDNVANIDNYELITILLYIARKVILKHSISKDIPTLED